MLLYLYLTAKETKDTQLEIDGGKIYMQEMCFQKMSYLTLCPINNRKDLQSNAHSNSI